MRFEDILLVIAGLPGLLGAWLLWDAASADRESPVRRERRRRKRAERDRLGEAAVGLGTLCIAAAIGGRDSWRYGNVAVIAGTILLVVGAALNLRFLRELLLFRGPARREPERAPRGAEVSRYERAEGGATVDAVGSADASPPASAVTVAAAQPVTPAAKEPRLRIR